MHLFRKKCLPLQGDFNVIRMTKTVTSPEQGNKLISLGISRMSADFFWSKMRFIPEVSPNGPKFSVVERENFLLYTINSPFYRIDAYAWSLASILDILHVQPYPKLVQDASGWRCRVNTVIGGIEGEYGTGYYSEAIDACVEMIAFMKMNGLM